MHKKLKLPEHIYIIGAGGVASYLLPPLVKTLRTQGRVPPKVIVVDGDILEARNLDRQLFRVSDVGTPKAAALVDLLSHDYPALEAQTSFFTEGYPIEESSLLIGCVDNHAARRAILATADNYECRVILAGNEYTDSQAMYYETSYRDSRLDPRIRYPEILTDHSGDPTRPRGCTGEAQEAAPQLAIANFGAAHHALQLFWFHFSVAPTLNKRDTLPFWPIEHNNNFNKHTTNAYACYA
jgi:hypothetical protein